MSALMKIRPSNWAANFNLIHIKTAGGENAVKTHCNYEWNPNNPSSLWCPRIPMAISIIEAGIFTFRGGKCCYMNEERLKGIAWIPFQFCSLANADQEVLPMQILYGSSKLSSTQGKVNVDNKTSNVCSKSILLAKWRPVPSKADKARQIGGL